MIGGKTYHPEGAHFLEIPEPERSPSRIVATPPADSRPALLVEDLEGPALGHGAIADHHRGRPKSPSDQFARIVEVEDVDLFRIELC